jgi:hypothetical protein
VYDGGGITRFVTTPKWAVQIRNRLQNATFVLYDGATNDVCELPTHEVLARGKVNGLLNCHDRGIRQVRIVEVSDLARGLAGDREQSRGQRLS